MKLAAILLLSLAPVITGVFGSPLPKENISADAKWMLHLDLDALRQSRLGAFLTREILEKETADLKQDLAEEFGFELDWSKIHSITAYGSDYRPQGDETGLLLVNTSLDLPALLSAVQTKTASMVSLQREGTNLPALYRIGQHGFLSLEGNGLLMLSKSALAIPKGRRVISQESPNLSSSKTLNDYPEIPFGFFLVGLADDFGQDPDLPPQAAVLKQASGGRLVIGEQSGQLRLQLDVKTASATVAGQIQQVAQGFLALASLSQDNPDLKRLAQGLRVHTQDSLVQVGLQLPIDEVMNKIEQNR